MKISTMRELMGLSEKTKKSTGTIRKDDLDNPQFIKEFIKGLLSKLTVEIEASKRKEVFEEIRCCIEEIVSLFETLEKKISFFEELCNEFNKAREENLIPRSSSNPKTWGIGYMGPVDDLSDHFIGHGDIWYAYPVDLRLEESIDTQLKGLREQKEWNKWTIPSIDEIQKELSQLDTPQEKVQYLEELNNELTLKRKLSSIKTSNLPQNYEWDILDILNGILSFKEYWKTKIPTQDLSVKNEIMDNHEKNENVQTNPARFPVDKWEDLTITYCIEGDKLIFSDGGSKASVTWKEMGFLDQRKKPPEDKPIGRFFRNYAQLIDIDKDCRLQNNEDIDKETFRKSMSALRKKLQSITGLKSDPFTGDPTNGYWSKFALKYNQTIKDSKNDAAHKSRRTNFEPDKIK